MVQEEELVLFSFLLEDDRLEADLMFVQPWDHVDIVLEVKEVKLDFLEAWRLEETKLLSLELAAD